MQQLGEEPRDLLVLASYHGLPYQQIAETLGIEVGAVKVPGPPGDEAAARAFFQTRRMHHAL